MGLIGAVFLVIAILSFARGVQRLFERTWELRPLSVRNTVNDLAWIAGLVGYLVLSGVAHREIGSSRIQAGANLVVAPFSAALGHEVSVELDRIATGERPPDDEVRREWDAIISEARGHRRHRRHDREKRPTRAAVPSGSMT